MINCDTIKKELTHTMEMVEQWKGHPSNHVEYFHKAEMLVELLEVDNCGSIGGYDVGQTPPSGNELERLKLRALWVLKDYE